LRYSASSSGATRASFIRLRTRLSSTPNPLGHFRGAVALVDEGGKRFKLIGRVHLQPDRVFPQGSFSGRVPR